MGTNDPCQESRRFLRIDAAFKAGDLAALLAELDDDADRFPNVVLAAGIGDCLTYAIYHSPVAFVAELLDLGADPNWPADDGFPPLIAAAVVRHVGTGLTGTARRPRDRGALARPRVATSSSAASTTTRHSTGRPATATWRWSICCSPTAPTRTRSLASTTWRRRSRWHRSPATARSSARLQPLTTRLDWEDASRTGDVKVLARMVRSGHDIDARDGYGQTALIARRPRRSHRCRGLADRPWRRARSHVEVPPQPR